MKKNVVKGLLSIGVLFCFLNVNAAQKPWTFLIYFAAANDLNTLAQSDVQEMMQVGSNDNVNIIAYLTTQSEGQEKQTKKIYIEKDNLIQVGPTLVRDSGDVATLMEALEWANVDYPSDHLAVVLWGNGSGPLNRSDNESHSRGICYDGETGHYLTDNDCFDAFAWACNSLRGGKKIDIIACNACLLASLEMAYTFAGCAHYFVASEEVIAGDGYHYAYLLNQLAYESLDALSVAKHMVNAYNHDYVGTSEYTLSAIDLNRLRPLIDNVNTVAQVLLALLKGKYSANVVAMIKKSINMNVCPSFDTGIYVDLCQFYKNILKNIEGFGISKSVEKQFQRVLNDGIKLFPTIVKANVTSKKFKNAGGLSIYFSRHSLDPSYYGLYWTKQNPDWLNFLEAFLG
jgi:Clostripain family